MRAILTGRWYASGGSQPQIASESDPTGRTLALVYGHCSDEDRDAIAQAIAKLPELLALAQSVAALQDDDDTQVRQARAILYDLWSMTDPTPDTRAY